MDRRRSTHSVARVALACLALASLAAPDAGALLPQSAKRAGCMSVLRKRIEVAFDGGTSGIHSSREEEKRWREAFVRHAVSEWRESSYTRASVFKEMMTDGTHPLIAFYKRAGATWNGETGNVPSMRRLIKQFYLERAEKIASGEWPKDLALEPAELVLSETDGAFHAIPWGTRPPDGFRRPRAGESTIIDGQQYFRFFLEGKLVMGGLDTVHNSNFMHGSFEHDLGHLVGILANPSYAKSLRDILAEHAFLPAGGRVTREQVTALDFIFESFEGFKPGTEGRWAVAGGPEALDSKEILAAVGAIPEGEIEKVAREEIEAVRSAVQPLGGARSDIFTYLYQRTQKSGYDTYDKTAPLTSLVDVIEKELAEMAATRAKGYQPYSTYLRGALAQSRYMSAMIATYGPGPFVEQFFRSVRYPGDDWLKTRICGNGFAHGNRYSIHYLYWICEGLEIHNSRYGWRFD